MVQSTEKCDRGSEWRVWDLHIHSPASFHWHGERFNGEKKHDDALIDEMVVAMNEALPVAFGIMDYWGFEGWFKLKKRLKEADSPELTKTVFPGIELRLSAPMKRRLNAHVLFSNKIEDQHLLNFKSQLALELVEQPLSPTGLVSYARELGADKLLHHGFDKEKVLLDDNTALRAGEVTAEISAESYKRAVESVPNSNALGFMPFSTNDGLSEIDRTEHYAYVLNLFRSSPIFETRREELHAAFSGIETQTNSKWFESFQAALKGVPRLAVSGSDAHRFVGDEENDDKRGYGQFPSGKKTWIKADPSWLGLQQALREPANRSFIGDTPPKLETIKSNRTFFVDTLTVEREPDSNIDADWLDGTQINLNADLVAIIGNKGSGKSALADIIALSGNSRQSKYFSFLKKDRFLGKTGTPASQFRANLNWHAGEPNEVNLADNADDEQVELVKYIPQGRFEALCNDHVSGKSDLFERELRSVIFEHLRKEVRLEAMTFDEVIDGREATTNEKISELRQSLSALNGSISRVEAELAPSSKRQLDELLLKKEEQLKLHAENEPKTVAQPQDETTEEQKQSAKLVESTTAEIDGLTETISKLNADISELAAKKRNAENVLERMSILDDQYQRFSFDTETALKALDIKLTDLVKFETDTKRLDDVISESTEARAKFDEELSSASAELAKQTAKKTLLMAELDKPQRDYQNYLSSFEEWKVQKDQIVGASTEPDSIEGLKAQKARIDSLPATLAQLLDKRRSICNQIAKLLVSQRDSRGELYEPAQQIIEASPLIKAEYRLKFKAELSASADRVASLLFDLVKRDVGKLRGEEESLNAMRDVFAKYDVDKAADAEDLEQSTHLAEAINALLHEAARAKEQDGHGLDPIMRKDRNTVDVYNYIYGLEYVAPQYSLKFQDTEIEQLSPGQRGALLLIFYLIVDKGRNPIILDQPEENLDNETVTSLLVPVLKEARKKRQIMMVTHNPNLAVVCDAEQIIHASIDRSEGPSITYKCGAIEAPHMNEHVVNVLEGTKRAFDNRGSKYH